MLIVYFVNSESYEAYLGCTSSLPLSGKKIPHLLVFQLSLLICLCYDLENFWLSIFVYLTYWRKFWVLWLVLVNLCCWSLRSKMFVLQLVLFLFFQGDLFIQFRSKSNCFVRLLQTYRQRFSKISRRKSLECFYRNIYLIKRSIVLIGLERLFNKVIDLRPANLLKRNSSTGIFTFFDKTTTDGCF